MVLHAARAVAVGARDSSDVIHDMRVGAVRVRHASQRRVPAAASRQRHGCVCATHRSVTGSRPMDAVAVKTEARTPLPVVSASMAVERRARSRWRSGVPVTGRRGHEGVGLSLHAAVIEAGAAA
jgi:hypothetical protein